MGVLAHLAAWWSAHADTVTEAVATTFHYCFIPAVLVVGMRTEPRPTLLQLIQPM